MAPGQDRGKAVLLAFQMCWKDFNLNDSKF